MVKLKALQEAAQKGWTDIAEGRYTDLADDQIEDFVGQLGEQAARRVQAAG
jgi:antitoxin ParD1/3/4